MSVIPNTTALVAAYERALAQQTARAPTKAEPAPDAGVNPKDAAGQRKPGLSCVPPIALLEEGVVMRLGAAKYGAFNWQETAVRASVYYDAALRHLLSWFAGEDVDPESGVSHLAHVRACCGILIDGAASGKMVDDRPRTTSAAEFIARRTQT